MHTTYTYTDVERVARYVAARCLDGTLQPDQYDALASDDGLIIDGVACWAIGDDGTLGAVGIFAYCDEMEVEVNWSEFDSYDLHRCSDAERLRPATRDEVIASFYAEFRNDPDTIVVDGIPCYIARGGN
jgi:hypothetical protein